MLAYAHMLLPVIAWWMNVVGQICVVRYIREFSLLKSILVGFIFGICALLLMECYYLQESCLPLTENSPFILANIIIYASLSYVYFHFVNLGETARRIRILRELYDSKSGLSLEEILDRYNAEIILKKRITRLIGNGQILYRQGRYYTGSPQMLWIAKVIVAMKIIILGKKSEFA